MSFINAISLAAIEATVPLIRLAQIFLGLISLLYLNDSDRYPPEANIFGKDTFDFIIVGAGSAGCVLANRLTEVSTWSVLLIEAGDNPNVISNTPALMSLVDSSKADWDYYSVDDGYSAQAHKTKNVHMPSGKMLGGSSGANYMYYVPGNKADFDQWVAEGNYGWDWNTVKYYFKKSQGYKDIPYTNSDSESLYNSDGHLGITRPDWPQETKIYFDALKENGRKILVDTNEFQQMGFTQPPMTIYNNTRQSTAVAFIRPIKNRKNLYILRNTVARKVILDDFNKAFGVEIKLADGKITKVMARKEIILSAGSFASPKLLMLSGIGPEDHLNEMDINVKVVSPHVGKNSEDHTATVIVVSGKQNPISALKNYGIIARPGLFPSPSILGHVALKKDQSYPDYQVLAWPSPAFSILTPIICSHVMKLEDQMCAALLKAGMFRESMITVIANMHPLSRGEIKLKSKNPDDHPLIYTGYFSDERDLERVALYLEDFLTILNTTVLKNVNAEVVDMDIYQCNHLKFGSHNYWKCFILNTVNTEFHTTSTCRMAKEGYGVVDERLRVYGAKNLRVVDASIMPHITSGNTNAPTIMIAEKAADMIKEEYNITAPCIH